MLSFYIQYYGAINQVLSVTEFSTVITWIIGNRKSKSEMLEMLNFSNTGVNLWTVIVNKSLVGPSEVPTCVDGFPYLQFWQNELPRRQEDDK